jgi:hypothetical protein
MKPESPIIPGVLLDEIVYAKDQPPYAPLPAFRYPDGVVLTRWHMTWKERLTVLFRGDVYVWLNTFNDPLQPIMLQVEKPKPADTSEEPRA